MIVVSDTSVISNLFLVQQLELLHTLFQSVIIPTKVQAELIELKNFGIDILPILQADFIEVKKPTDSNLVKEFLLSLDEGEAEAITLAIELKADIILIDELKGRAIAEQNGLEVTGILGILLNSKKAGHIELVAPILEDLRYIANFFIGQKLYDLVLEKAGESVID